MITKRQRPMIKIFTRIKISPNGNKQRGATLIVALVLLAIVTIVGIAGMRGSNLEMKMIASARDRAMAFEAAEAALKIVENNLIKYALKQPLPAGVTIPDLTNVASVFSKDCKTEKGYCFTGVIDAAKPYESCTNYNVDEPVNTPLWEQASIWNTASLTQTVTVATTPDGKAAEGAVGTMQAQYIVEFMCFTLKDKTFFATEDDKNNNTASEATHMPMYRITASVEGLGGRSRVMAQSLVKINLSEGF